MNATTPVWPSGPNTAGHERLRGKVERHDGRLLLGWLIDPAEPELPVVFDLEANGQPAGRFTAGLLRGDLEQKRIGTGRHGFRVPVPASVLSLGLNEFRLVTVPGGLELTARIEVAQLPPPLPSAAVAAPVPAATLGGSVAPARLGVVTAAALPVRPAAAAALASVPAPLGPEPAARPTILPAAQPPADAVPPATSGVVRELIARLGPAAQSGLRDYVAGVAAQRDWQAVLLLTEALPAPMDQDPELALERGRALLALGEAERAEAVLRGIERHDPGHHRALFELALALEKQQRFAEAAELLARCRALDPADGRYLMQAARTAAQLVNGGNGAVPERPELLDQALALAREAIALLPRDGRPWRDLARLLYQAGDAEGALAAMQEAETRQPGNASFLMERARILLRLDRVEAAAAAAAEAASLDPASDAAASMREVLERWAAARRAGPWRIAPLAEPGTAPAA